MTKLGRVYVCTSGSLKYDFVLLEGYCSLSSKLHFGKEKKGGGGEGIWYSLHDSLRSRSHLCVSYHFFPPLKL